MTTQPEAELIFEFIGYILGQIFSLMDSMMLGSKSLLDYSIALAYFETAIAFLKKLVSSTSMSDSDLKYEERKLERQKGGH